MKMRAGWVLTLLSLVLGAALAEDGPPAQPSQEEPEALVSGPVHEAFAAPVDLQAQPGLVAPTAPPAPVVETPPANRPVGASFAWIPGYWAWEGRAKRYVWVSACWRAAPPGLAWVPGYWTKVDAGWQWVPGFWTKDGAKELEYLGAPPAPRELEPPGPPPTSDACWVPGCWYWRDGHWVLRHGYWLEQHHGWLWTPSHLVWTPRGWVFAPGHWDLSLDRRGVLFAPVAISVELGARPGWCYTPRIVFDLTLMSDDCFVYPSYCHYFVGDCYDPWWLSVGVYPRFHHELPHHCYDPLWIDANWHHHDGLDRWHEQLHQAFDHRRDDPATRPAGTFHQQQAEHRPRLGLALGDLPASGSTRVSFEPLGQPARAESLAQAARVGAFRADRMRWESQRRVGESERVPFGAPPVVGHASGPAAPPATDSGRPAPSAGPPDSGSAGRDRGSAGGRGGGGPRGHGGRGH